MSFRFRKSVKIAPGIRVNFSKSGVSTSIGKRGATVNISKKGTRITTGIHGTGLSTSKLYPSKKRAQVPVPRTYSKSEWVTSFIIGAAICLLFAFKTTGSAQVLSILALVGFLIAIFAAAISSKETDRTQPSTGAPQTSAIPKSKSIAPTSWQDRAAAVGALVDPSDISRKSVNFVKIEPAAIMSDQLLRSSGRQANINGTSTHEFENKKDDLKTMVDYTQAEIANYWQQAVGERISAAPFYFERAAILYRKNKQYQEEIEVCEAWIAIMSDYTTQDMKQYAEVHLGTRSKAIYHRLPKARELLERSQK